MMENPDQNSDYALRAIQEPRLRETEEFNQWISVPENKELFLDLMACKEAVMRESLDRRRKAKMKTRIWLLLWLPFWFWPFLYLLYFLLSL